MNCDSFSEEFELFVLGTLERAEAEAIREHLATGCVTCRARLGQAVRQTARVSATVPLLEPSTKLRNRVAASVGAVVPMPKRKPLILPWALAAALLLLALGGVIGSRILREREQAVDRRAQELARLTQVLNILQSPEKRVIAVNDPKNADVRANVYISPNAGAALVTSSLPEIPAGSKYESWIVPKQGSPRPIEGFHANGHGQALTLIPGPLDLSQIAAVAVSVEPQDSSPVKPTRVLFAAPI